MSRALRDKGGNQLVIIELDENLAVPGSITNGTNALNCGLIFESQVDIDAKTEKFKAEDGKTYGQDEEFEGRTAGVLMETSKLIADYLAFGTRGKLHLEIKYEGIKDGKHQEVLKIANVTPQMHFKTPGGTKAMKYESVSVVQPQPVVISPANITAIESALGVNIRTTGPVTIPAEQEHVIVETEL
ncbi:MAG TPA: hypothetical protein PKE39_09780 [Ignavibacteria bacterium]|nr:hypothetical protein [Ignavibacteria bacterium]HMQ99301.1 hypothetical protein [Ignavibacteria bacterium]